MWRFESTAVARLWPPAGGALEAWVAEGPGVRLAGLAGLRGLPPGRCLLLPRCRSVHTAGMRFPIDVAFLAWPPGPEGCQVLAVRAAVPPFRVASAGRRPRGRTAALEAAAGSLAGAGVRPGTRLRLDSG